MQDIPITMLSAAVPCLPCVVGCASVARIGLPGSYFAFPS